MKFQLALLAPVLTGALAAAQQTRSPADGIYSAEQAKRGESIYQQHCSSCHSANLRGSEGGPALVGPDFTANWDGVKLFELFEKIKTTMPQTAPATLADSQYADVLAFVLAKGGFPAGQSDLPSDSEVLRGVTYKPPKP